MTCLMFWVLVLMEMEEFSTVAVLENVVLVMFVICALPLEAHVEKGCVWSLPALSVNCNARSIL